MKTGKPVPQKVIVIMIPVLGVRKFSYLWFLSQVSALTIVCCLTISDLHPLGAGRHLELPTPGFHDGDPDY